MTDTLPPLVQEYRAKADQLLDEQKKVRKSTKEMTDETEQNTGKMKSSFGEIAGGVAIGSLAVDAMKAGLGALGGAIKASVANASDLNEAGTAVGAVFGDAYAGIRQWAEGADSALGISTLQALDAAKTFGVYGQAAGLSADANAQFSETLVKTAGDLASFHNANPADVIEALGAGLRGESEPLRKYGILLNDAALQAQAMKMGIADGTQPLTAQQKVLASNAVIMAQVGAAQGDFAKTSGGLANQQRILAAQMTNLSASVGTIFLPILQTAIQFVTSNVMPGLNHLASTLADKVGPAFDFVKGAVGAVKDVLATGDFTHAVGEALGGIQEDSPIIGFLLGLRDVFGQVAGFVTGTIVPAFVQLWGVFGPLIGQIAGVWAQLSPMSIILQALLPVLPAVVDAVTGMATAIGGALGSALQVIIPAISQVAEMLSGGLTQVVQALVPVLLSLLPVITQLVSMIAGQFATTIAQLIPVVLQIVPVIVTLATTIGGVLGKVLTALMPIIAQIIGLLMGQLGKILLTLVPIVVQLASVIGGVLGNVLQMLAPLLVLIAGFIGDLLTAIMPLVGVVLQLVMAFLPLLEPIIKLVGALLEPLIGLLTTLLTPILSLVSAFIQFLVPAITAVISVITSYLTPIIQSIVQVLGGVIDFVVGVFTGNWSRAWDGIVSIFSGIFNGLKGIAANVINGVIDTINGMIGAVNGALGAIRDLSGGAINLNIPSIPHASFDVGTARVPGATGAPLPAIIHGGEAILSNEMLAGRAPIPDRVRDAVNREQGAPGGGAGNATYNSVTVHAKTDASASQIAAEVGWELRKNG